MINIVLNIYAASPGKFHYESMGDLISKAEAHKKATMNGKIHSLDLSGVMMGFGRSGGVRNLNR